MWVKIMVFISNLYMIKKECLANIVCLQKGLLILLYAKDSEKVQKDKMYLSVDYRVKHCPYKNR